MNENVKKVLEAVSNDDSLMDKMKNASYEDVLAIAADLGLPLSKEDIDANKADLQSVDPEELADVSGGDKCVCAIGGSGKATREGQRQCICALGGWGETDIVTGILTRCYCAWAGGGKDKCFHDY